MDIDSGKFFNWEVVAFAVGLYILVFILRRLVEGFWKKALANYYWSEIVLPILPPVLGALIALVAVSYPYPEIVKTAGVRVFYGLGMGFFSGWAYRVFKSVLKKLTGVDVDLPGNTSAGGSDAATTDTKPPADVKKPDA